MELFSNLFGAPCRLDRQLVKAAVSTHICTSTLSRNFLQFIYLFGDLLCSQHPLFGANIVIFMIIERNVGMLVDTYGYIVKRMIPAKKKHLHSWRCYGLRIIITDDTVPTQLYSWFLRHACLIDRYVYKASEPIEDSTPVDVKHGNKLNQIKNLNRGKIYSKSTIWEIIAGNNGAHLCSSVRLSIYP